MSADETQNLTNLNTDGKQEESDYDDEEDDNIVRVITPNGSKQKWIKSGLIAMCILITVITIVTVSIYNTNVLHKSNNNEVAPINMDDYVLANATVIISSNTTSSIAGAFLVDEKHYEFKSVSKETSEFIEFVNINDERNDGWIGFKISYLNKSKISFEFYSWQSDAMNVQMVEITKHTTASRNETKLLDIFFEDLLCEHFVELSVKLGVKRYTGSQSHAIEDIHRLAEWIWKFKAAEAIQSGNWVCYYSACFALML